MLLSESALRTMIGTWFENINISPTTQDEITQNIIDLFNALAETFLDDAHQSLSTRSCSEKPLSPSIKQSLQPKTETSIVPMREYFFKLPVMLEDSDTPMRQSPKTQMNIFEYREGFLFCKKGHNIAYLSCANLEAIEDFFAPHTQAYEANINLSPNKKNKDKSNTISVSDLKTTFLHLPQDAEIVLFPSLAEFKDFLAQHCQG